MTDTMTFIDSHVHLFHEDFSEDLSDVIDRARDERVSQFIVPATDVVSAEKCLDIARQYQEVFVAVGIHPHDVSKASENDIQKIRALKSEKHVVAIGEIGLDYFYDISPPSLQKEFFHAQLEIASDADMPVIIHTRDSMADAIDMVRQHVEQNPDWCRDESNARRGVFHCFTGSEEQARSLFALGFYVSFPGMLTFKNSPVRDVFTALHMERILLETDAPYLAPVPHRGNRNEPAYLLRTAEKMSELTGRDLNSISQTTRKHTMDLFRMT